jgi:hypothetical protein
MELPRRKFLHLAAGAAALPAVSCIRRARAQDYPAMPVRIITHSAPGGAADALLRIVADRLSQSWCHQVVVLNYPGAGGAVVNFLRDQVGSQTNVDPDQKQRRLNEIPGMVESARAKVDEEKSPKAQPALPTTLAQVIKVFDRWLVLNNHKPIYAFLGTIAANLLPGDPVWLGIIAPPSSAKTEILNSASRLPFTQAVGTLTTAALLSGTPKRQRDKTAKGGLLCKIGAFGILVLKDFGSVLSMRPDNKAETIAALREVYDGSWTRHLGTDGGRTLDWAGKIGLIFGATQAYDDHYSVIGSLGDRFLLCRLGASFDGQLKKAFDHKGTSNKTMRDELAAAVAGLFTIPLIEPEPFSEAELLRLNNVVKLVVSLRAHVTRDRFSREIENIHDAEGPGRIGLCLERLFCGLVAIGFPRSRALRLIEDIAMDSTPPIRRHAFETLDDRPSTTRDIARALGLPTNTTRRALEELHAHGLATRSRAKVEQPKAEDGLGLWEPPKTEGAKEKKGGGPLDYPFAMEGLVGPMGGHGGRIGPRAMRPTRDEDRTRNIS